MIDLTFSCNKTSVEDPCPAMTLYDRAYDAQPSDIRSRSAFHHAWHARDNDVLRAYEDGVRVGQNIAQHKTQG